MLSVASSASDAGELGYALLLAQGGHGIYAARATRRYKAQDAHR
jgi:hypothetical protein